MKKLPFFCLVLAILAAFAVESHAQANTIVRFRVSYGSTLLGNVDVELFDQDKPVTVSNFLAYVDSGRFKRTFLHRLIPGFIVQGGTGTIGNPYSGSLFEVLNAMVKDPAITNEFNTGSVRSNLFGTLAMAKVAGDTNSATSEWFFNLGNNSANRGSAPENLDEQNGGFTVFGQAIAGTNLFTTLNSLAKVDSRGNAAGIIDVSDFFSYGFFCGFTYILENDDFAFWANGSDLPVSYLGNFCVRYSDLLIVDVFRLAGSTPDTTSPTIALQTPAANATLDSSSVVVSGTASDNVGVTSVDVILNHDRSITAQGTTDWSLTLTNLPPGSNTVTVVSIDANGNQSKPIFRNFFHRVQEPIQLNIAGDGTVTGLTDGQVLDLGRSYTLTAKPAKGYVFQGWTGTVSSASTTISFFMQSNTVVGAVFIPNPFIPTSGIYNGLFSEDNTLRNDRAGYLTLKLTDRGTYSGKVTIEGQSYSIKGEFGLIGTANKFIVRSGPDDLLIQMRLDLTNGTCQLTGTVSAASGGTWSASLIADQATFNKKLNPAPQAGQYTMIIPGTDGASGVPRGDSYGSVKVDGNGKVTLIGLLADGSKLVQKTVLSKNGTWPFFSALYSGKGLAIGWLDVVPGGLETDIVGDVIWLKTLAAGGPYYPNGFLKSTNVLGSLFTKPATSTTRIVDIASGTVSFEGGDLPVNFSNAVEISEKSAVTTTDANKLTLKFSKSKGMMKGVVSLPSPNDSQKVKFSGVVLQKQNIASGFFLGVDESGKVLLSSP